LRLSLSTASLYVYPLRHIFAIARDVGFEGVELVVCPEVLLRGAEYVRRLSQEYGLPIFTLHPSMIPTPRSRQHHRLLPQLTRLALDLDCQFIVIHTPKALSMEDRLGREYTEAVKKCVQELSGASPRLCIENQAVFRPGDRRYALCATDSLRRFVDEHDLPVTLDTAHVASFPYDLLETYETMRDRLVNVHLSDFRDDVSIPPWFNMHSYFKHHQLPGDGDLPLGRLLRRLREDRYEGPVTIEVSPFALQVWRPGRIRGKLAECLEFVRAAP
jgi:sugar phosphate isomerase/epimerase